jgi:hypothetical protein
VWVDGRGNTGVDIYYKHSTDNGLTWSQDTAIVNYNLNSFFPNIAVLGNNLHVVWEDDRENSKHEIYYKRSTNAGFTWDADTRLTFDTNYSEHSFVAVSNSSVHVVWRDNRNSNFEVYYKKDPTGNPIGIQSISSEVPDKFSLYQNYPNPFNPSTKIEFSVPSAGIVKLKVFDFLGREISTPINERLNTGTYSFDFDGSGLASGVYLYQLSSGEYLQTRKMILIK